MQNLYNTAMMHGVTRSMAIFLGCSAMFAEVPSAVAIRNARLVTVSSGIVEKGTIVVRDGLIEGVGASVTVPGDAWVIDGAGLTVYPGLIDGLSTWGIPDAVPMPRAGASSTSAPAAVATPRATGPEDRPSNTSWTRAADLVRNSDRRLEAARNAGFTTAVTFPQRGIFAGQGAIINLAGTRAGEMVVASPVGLYMTLAGSGGRAETRSYPDSLMGVFAYIRQVMLDAEHYRLVKEDYAKNAGGKKRPPYDRALEGVLDSPRLLLPANTVVEMDRVLRFAAEFKTPTVVYGAHEAYRAADMLKRHGATALVNLRWPERARDADPDQVESFRTLETRDKAPAGPAILAKAGVRFAFYSGGIENPREILRATKKALDAGLSNEAAVRALTLTTAEIYNVADRLGSLDSGKIANLVVTDGDIFQERTRVRFVLIDGVKIEPSPETPPAITSEAAQ